MRENDTNINENTVEETVKVRKKQKAPIGIRPSDYLEAKFKEEAEREGLTQTKLFEKVFRDYLNNASDEYRNRNLDCSLEIQTVKGASDALVKAIEQIVKKSQDELARKGKELESIKEATDKKIELATLELNNKIAELENENKQLVHRLESSNAVVEGFNTVKQDLEDKNVVLKSALDNKDAIIEELKNELKERDKALKSLEKEINNSAKAVSNIEKEIALLKEENASLFNRNASLNSNIEMLQGTLSMFNTIKAQEITAIKENEATMSQLKLDKLNAEFENEVSKLNNTISSLKTAVEDKNNEIELIKEIYNNTLTAKEEEIVAKYTKEIAVLNSNIKGVELDKKELESAVATLQEKLKESTKKNKDKN